MFAQNLLDAYDSVSLQDLVDGSNVSEEWGTENLDLEGEVDVEWAQRMNTLMEQSSDWLNFCAYPTKRALRRNIWLDTVRGKGAR